MADTFDVITIPLTKTEPPWAKAGNIDAFLVRFDDKSKVLRYIIDKELNMAPVVADVVCTEMEKDARWLNFLAIRGYV